MLTERKYHGLTWIEADKPHLKEVQALAADWKLHPALAADLLARESQAKADLYGNYLHSVFHFPVVGSEGLPYEPVAFVIGKDLIITVSHADQNPFHEFGKVFETNSLLGKNEIGEHAGYIFFYMMKRFYHGLFRDVELLGRNLLEIESNIFLEKEKEMVIALSKASREILNLKKAMTLQEETLHSFKEASGSFFDASFEPYITLLIEDCRKLRLAIKSHQEFLVELRMTNNSLLTTKQSEVMRSIGILSFFTFPLVLIVQILSYASPSNPLFGIANSFWLIVGIVAIVGLLMLMYFKHKRWI